MIKIKVLNPGKSMEFVSESVLPKRVNECATSPGVLIVTESIGQVKYEKNQVANHSANKEKSPLLKIHEAKRMTHLNSAH